MTLLMAGGPACASDVDSEHLFGFTEGADIGKRGEREAETETIGHLGKSSGSYAAVYQNNSLKVLPSDHFRVSANVTLGYFQISDVPDLGDRRLANLMGASFEARYMLVDRQHGPFGLTLIAEPRWGRIDPTSGEMLTSYGALFTVVADKEVVDDRLFATVNLLYDSQTTRLPVPGVWSSESKLGMSSALSARVSSVLFLGGEVRYVRAYDGLGLDALSGQALFAGPTFYLQIAHGMALSGGFNAQIIGRASRGDALDLTHFERRQAKLRFNMNF